MAELLLQYCIAVERRLWPHGSPLRQFEGKLSCLPQSELLENARLPDMRSYSLDLCHKDSGVIRLTPLGLCLRLTLKTRSDSQLLNVC